MYAKLSRSAAIRGQLDKVTPHRGESHGNEKHTYTHTHRDAFSSLLSHSFSFCLTNILYYMYLTANQHGLRAIIVIHYSLSPLLHINFIQSIC